MKYPYTNLSREEKEELLAVARAEYIGGRSNVSEYYTAMRRCGLSATEIEENLISALAAKVM